MKLEFVSLVKFLLHSGPFSFPKVQVSLEIGCILCSSANGPGRVGIVHLKVQLDVVCPIPLTGREILACWCAFHVFLGENKTILDALEVHLL